MDPNVPRIVVRTKATAVAPEQLSFSKKAYMWYQALFSTYKKRLFVTFYIILSILTNKKIVRDNTLGNLVNR